MLLSPVVDLTMSGATFVTHVERDPVFALETLLGIRSLYLRPEQLLDVRASPLFGDFHEFPPLLFQVGSEEVLLDDTLRAARRATSQRIGGGRVWQNMARLRGAAHTLPQATAAARSIVQFIARKAEWSLWAWRSEERRAYGITAHVDVACAATTSLRQ